MLKKLFILITVFILAGCGINTEKTDDELNITATLFPQYDFVREVSGELNHIKLLMPPGAESHSYEPTPKDIIEIEKSDIFIYTGKNMESWAEKILKGIDNKELKVVDISKGTELIEDDPHIWTNPVNAIKMVENIILVLCDADPENEEYYKLRGNNYIQRLKNLDTDIRETVKNAKRREIVSGDRFAMNYFIREYGLMVKSAYESCQHGAEPGAGTVADVISYIKSNDIPVIYYKELSTPKVAKMIGEETNKDILLLHSCHNLSKEEFEKGEGYLTLMEKNLENLKRGIN